MGLRPTSVDDSPILGALPGMGNVFVATGHGANGLLLGPLTGKVMADLVTSRKPEVDITRFAASRFKN